MAYKDHVLSAFDELHRSWEDWPHGKLNGNDSKIGSWWHVANSLDAALDFIIQASAVWGDTSKRKTVSAMIAESYAIFHEVYANQKQLKPPFTPGYWWDDYGWWGIAFLKVHDHFALLWDEGTDQSGPNDPPVTRAGCLDIAKDCWEVMSRAAERVNNSLSPGDAGPVSGGCWNNLPEQGGVQNTVTNGVFMTLSIRLFLSTEEQRFLVGAWREFLWFNAWCANDDLLLKRLGPETSLLLERPHDPRNPTYNAGPDVIVPYVEGQMWTGDQGLWMGGLTGLLEAHEKIESDPDFLYLPTVVLHLAQEIANGMTWLYDSAQVLHEARLDDALHDFYVDYSTGKGVFMRYLAYAWQKLNLSYSDYIEATAQSALKHGYRTVKNEELSLSWNTKKTGTKLPTNDTTLMVAPDKTAQVTLQSSRLDGLNAAIPLISD